MARWKLMAAHYLKVLDEDWEYSEIDRTTGRPKKLKLPVPRHLDPSDPTCWTNRWGNNDNADGEIIVCLEGKGESKDVVFFGDPTPDMVPIDDEAKAISATFEKRWGSKPENMAGDYSQSLVDRFQTEMAEVQAKPVEVPGMSDLIAAIKGLVEVSAPARRV